MMPGSMVESHRSEGHLTTAADPHEVDLQHRQHSMMEDQLSRKHLSRTPRKLTGGDRHWVPCWHAEAGWARGGTGCRCLSVARCLPEVSGQLQGGGPLLSGVFLNDDLPSLNVAGVGSTRSTSGGFAAVVRCPFERWLSVIECCLCGSARSISGGLQLLACVFF